MNRFVKRSILLLLITVSICLHGQNLSYYSFSSVIDSTKWVTLSDSISIIPQGSGDNGTSSLLPIGFSFPFGESEYSHFSVNTDGNLRLGEVLTTNLGYNNPFSSFNCNTNSPKINLLGCDGYLQSSGYVYYQHFVDNTGDSLLVIEFATSTYNNTSRGTTLKWQVHLYQTGDIVLVVGSEVPSVMPAVSRQPGLCDISGEGWVITSDTTATTFSRGTSLSIPSGNWFDPNRCFSFNRPNLSCPRVQYLSCTDITSSRATISFESSDSAATSWILSYDSIEMSLTGTSVTLDNLLPHTTYTVFVRTDCGTDTSIAVSRSFTTLYQLPPIDQIVVDSIRPCAARISWDYSPSLAEFTPTSFQVTLNAIDTTYSFAVVGNDTIVGGLMPHTHYQVVVEPRMDSLVGVRNTALFQTADSACSSPLLSHVESGSNAISLRWIPGYYDSLWIVEYKMLQDSIWTIYDTVATTSIEIEGLLGGLNYNIRVGAICGGTIGYVGTTIFVPSCPAISGLRSTQVDATIATIHWQGSANSYKVEYGPHGFFLGQGTVLLTNADSCDLVGLVPDTRYDVYVYGICAPGDTTTASMITFSTNCLCPQVSSLSATVLSTSSVSVDWTAAGADSLWQIEYGVKGFSLGEGVSHTTTTHPDTLANLLPGSRYEIYVRPICGLTDTGRWVKAQFVTDPCVNPVGHNMSDTDAVSENSHIAAVNNNKNYSLTEIILDRSILNGENIFVALNLYYTGQVPMLAKNDVDIYLMTCNIDSFSTADTFVPLQSWAKKVYSGPLNCSYGWNTIVFDTSYYYGGWDNLMMIIDDNSGASDGPSCTFRTLSASSGKMLTFSHDNINPAIDSLDTIRISGNVFYGRPEMELVSCGAECATPFLLQTTDITCQSATLHWIGTAFQYEVSYRVSTGSSWSESVITAVDSVDISGLTANTRYSFRIRQVCDSNLYSSWEQGTFVTDTLPCFVPTGLHASSVVVGGATLEWDNGGVVQPQTWIINIFNDEDNRMDTIRTTRFEVLDLDDGVDYQAAVRKMCQSGYVTDWSDTIAFTTILCRPVKSIMVSDVTPNSALLSWTPGGNSNEWMIQFGDLSEDVDSVVVILGTSSYTINAVENHLYHAKVRSICDDRVYSDWSEDVYFRARFVDVEAADESGIEIYPNPTSSTANIDLTHVNGVKSVSIFDINGSLRYQMETDSQWLQTPRLAQGSYIVTVRTDQVLSVKRLIVR